jgi:hypothetical protein
VHLDAPPCVRHVRRGAGRIALRRGAVEALARAPRGGGWRLKQRGLGDICV